MNPNDKLLLGYQMRWFGLSYLFRFTIDLVVAVIIGSLILSESFGVNNKLACLVAIVYAQLMAVSRLSTMKVEGNSAKLDAVSAGESAASRELADAQWIALNEIHRKYYYLYACLHLGMLCVAFWKLLI
jgi:hypothetical protein